MVIGAAHTAPACVSTNGRSQSFPKRKTVPSTCFTFNRPTRSLWGCHSPTHMWHMDFDCPKSCSCTCLQLHWHRTSPCPRSTLGGGNRVPLQFLLACPQRSSCVLGHSVLVHEPFESSTFLGGAFCVAHLTLLNMEFVRNFKLAARIDLRGLRWNATRCNAIDIFFSRRFYAQQATCSPQFVVPEPTAFPCRTLTSILRSKT
jgi:hypothetical protein